MIGQIRFLSKNESSQHCPIPNSPIKATDTPNTAKWKTQTWARDRGCRQDFESAGSRRKKFIL